MICLGTAPGGEGRGLVWVEGGEIQRELGVICEIRVEAKRGAMSFYRKRRPPFLWPNLYLYRALIITILTL